MTRLIYIFMALLVPLCYSCKKETSFVYENPNNQLDFRDTHIIPHNGKYYAVGTCPPVWGGPNPGVKIYSSDDLMNWKYEKLLIDASLLPDTVWFKDRFWAPELHKIQGKFYLTFNCQNNSSGYGDTEQMRHWHGCGVAIAEDILGPYTVMTPDKPLVNFPSNDMTLFEDEDNKVYAFFNNGWTNVHKIFVAEFNPNTCSLKEEPIPLISQDTTKFTWDCAGIEGSNVVKNNGVYYLFYSSWTNGYAVGIATSTNIRGPWKKDERNPLFGAFTRNDSTFVVREGTTYYESESPLLNIGHNSVFKGPDGRWWTSCHADIKDSKIAQTIIDPFWFTDGKLKTNCPTYTKQIIRY